MSIYQTMCEYSLDAMEKLDRRETFTERLGYKFARKIFDIAFVNIHGISPYDYNNDWSDNE